MAEKLSEFFSSVFSVERVGNVCRPQTQFSGKESEEENYRPVSLMSDPSNLSKNCYQG